MSNERKPVGDDATADSPTAWFAVLERALLIGDYDLASQAQRELERLGVVVKFPVSRPNRKGGSDAR